MSLIVCNQTVPEKKPRKKINFDFISPKVELKLKLELKSQVKIA